MKEVKWESPVSSDYVIGHIGCVNLRCYRIKMSTGAVRWYSNVWIQGCHTYTPHAKVRHSLSKAKEDCIRLAYETMMNYRDGLKEEFKNFDLEME